jgi:hypothetical protein
MTIFAQNVMFGAHLESSGGGRGYRCIFSKDRLRPCVFVFDVWFGSTDKTELLRYVKEETGWIENYLEEVFRDTLILSFDDPNINLFRELELSGACDLRYISQIGIPEFAKTLTNDFRSMALSTTQNIIDVLQVSVYDICTDEGSNKQ